MRDLNTVGLKGAADSKRDKMMGSPRPGYGRVNRVYEPQGSYGYGGRLGPPIGGRKDHKSYRHNPNLNPIYTSIILITLNSTSKFIALTLKSLDLSF